MTNDKTVTMSRELAVTIKITAQQEEDILRFFDTCEDGQGYDVPKPRMKSLARLGLIRSTGFSRYEITDAGDSAIEKLCQPIAAPVVERQQLNQCDGCRAGKPLEDGKHHVMVNSGGYRDVMACTAHLYSSPPAPVAVVLPERKNERPFGDSTTAAEYNEAKGFNRAIDKVKELNR